MCLPCNCKGHADSCDDITGICRVSVVVVVLAVAFLLTSAVDVSCNNQYDRIAGTTVRGISAKGATTGIRRRCSWDAIPADPALVPSLLPPTSKPLDRPSRF